MEEPKQTTADKDATRKTDTERTKQVTVAAMVGTVCYFMLRRP